MYCLLAIVTKSVRLLSIPCDLKKADKGVDSVATGLVTEGIGCVGLATLSKEGNLPIGGSGLENERPSFEKTRV